MKKCTKIYVGEETKIKMELLHSNFRVKVSECQSI